MTRHSLLVPWAVVWSLLPAIGLAHAGQVIVVRRAAAPPSGTCATTPDLSNVVIAGNWKNATCVSGAVQAYTLEIDTGDYPDGAMSWADPGSGDKADLDDNYNLGPLTDCVFDYNAASVSEAAGNFQIDVTAGTPIAGKMSLYAEFQHNAGTDDSFSTAPTQLMNIGSTTNSLTMMVWSADTNTNVRCTGDDNAGTDNVAETNGHVANGCCGAAAVCDGPADPIACCTLEGLGTCCDQLLASGGYGDNRNMSIECVADYDTDDVLLLYIDGCLVDTELVTGQSLDVPTNSDGIAIGAVSVEAGDYRLGRWMISGTDEVLSLKVTGETSSPTNLDDADECWCKDVNGGADCDS